ncbi:hypothetical protein FB559_4953 [Actinoallomurus bryophytorum]|uniref:Uncharacterized protein n=1 Tax=Actinoallomurus bryophytorum TaxID=1490222 RepID=A0A543CQB6_9ACTN|nr:hypothetical protein FB559_4953 [Actinoallomurus bryophytorum]
MNITAAPGRAPFWIPMNVRRPRSALINARHPNPMASTVAA